MAVDGKVKEKGSFGKSIVNSFNDTKAEAKRITWASKEETKKSFIAVIVFCLLWIAVVAILDFGFTNLFTNFIFKFKL